MSGTGQTLYRRARKVMPGGTQLLSKRPEMFLPEQWPAYFSKTKGCKVWDLDGVEYTDMCIMGIGTNTLGYGNEEVNAAVGATVAAHWDWICGPLTDADCAALAAATQAILDLVNSSRSAN